MTNIKPKLKKCKSKKASHRNKQDQKLPSELIENILNIRQFKSLKNIDLLKSIEKIKNIHSIYKNTIYRLKKNNIKGESLMILNNQLHELYNYFIYDLKTTHNKIILEKDWYTTFVVLINGLNNLNDLKYIIEKVFYNSYRFKTYAPFFILPEKLKSKFYEILDKSPDFSKAFIDNDLRRFYDEDQDEFIIPNNFKLSKVDMERIKKIVLENSDIILKNIQDIINYYEKPQHKFYI